MTDELTRAIVVDDEQVHVPYGAPNWRENCWLTWFDAANELRGIVYQNLQPRLERGFALVKLFHRDRPLLVFSDPQIAWSDCSHEGRRSGPVRFECLEPFGRWRVQVKTDAIDLDLTWHPLLPTYDWDWGVVTQSRHYEQFVRVEGRLAAGDEAWTVDGLGQRDHAWGHRDPTFLKQAWSGRAFFDARNCQLTTLIEAQHGSFMFGYALLDGTVVDLDRIDVHRLDAYSGGPPLATELRAWGGGELVIDQQTRLESALANVAVGAHGESRQHFTFSEFNDGRGRSTVGQLDAWWTAPLHQDAYLTGRTNSGRWTQL